MTVSKDNGMRLVDTVSGREIGRIDHGDSIDSVTFSPDSRFLVTVSNRTARLLEIATGRVTDIEHAGVLHLAAFLAYLLRHPQDQSPDDHACADDP